MDRPTTGQAGGQPPANPLWLSIAEAAVRLGLTENAVRHRIKRRTLRSRKGNDGRVLVLLDPAGEPPANDQLAIGQAGGQPPAKPVDQAAEVARLTALLEGAAARLADRDEQIAQLRADAERERADHRAELDRLAAAHAAEIGRLQELLNKLSEPWWRRWFRPR